MMIQPTKLLNPAQEYEKKCKTAQKTHWLFQSLYDDSARALQEICGVGDFFTESEVRIERELREKRDHDRRWENTRNDYRSNAGDKWLGYFVAMHRNKLAKATIEERVVALHDTDKNSILWLSAYCTCDPQNEKEDKYRCENLWKALGIQKYVVPTSYRNRDIDTSDCDPFQIVQRPYIVQVRLPAEQLLPLAEKYLPNGKERGKELLQAYQKWKLYNGHNAFMRTAAAAREKFQRQR